MQLSKNQLLCGVLVVLAIVVVALVYRWAAKEEAGHKSSLAAGSGAPPQAYVLKNDGADLDLSLGVGGTGPGKLMMVAYDDPSGTTLVLFPQTVFMSNLMQLLTTDPTSGAAAFVARNSDGSLGLAKASGPSTLWAWDGGFIWDPKMNNLLSLKKCGAAQLCPAMVPGGPDSQTSPTSGWRMYPVQGAPPQGS